MSGVRRLFFAGAVALLLTAFGPGETEKSFSAPIGGQFTLVPTITTATFNQMLGLYPIPGAPDEAVVITQNGFLWRVSLSDSFSAVPFGDLNHCHDAADDDGDTRVNDGCLASGAAESGAGCTDAVDNDGDGFINDGCGVFGPNESPCNDAVDNEGDGYVNDGCPASGPSEAEPGQISNPPHECADTIDNDNDTFINDGCPAITPTERKLQLGSEEGLVGLAFSPNYQTDGRVYLYYTGMENSPPDPTNYCCRDRLARFQVTNNALDLNSEVLLLDQHDREPWHISGQLAFGPDGYLYVGLGDEGWTEDPYNNGQNKQVLYGKILRINVTGQAGYTIPPGNPFADGPGGNADEIFAYGLRNPWRFSFDSATGDIWLGEVGQAAYEEVNKVVAGGNYGWDVMEGPGCRIGGCTPPPGQIPPRASYCHPQWISTCPGYPEPGDCAIIGGFVYRGTEMPELEGWYVYGDFCTGKIWALDAASNISPPVLLLDSPYGISSFAQLPDGELVVLTYNNAIYRLAADSDTDGVANSNDNCPAISNTDQLNTDGDALGNACDSDDDNDLVYDSDEGSCGGDAVSAASRPERVDGAFSGVDDDGDTLADEALPTGSEAYDCDGDGFTGSVEAHVETGAQDACGNDGWPLDLFPGGFEPNTLNIQDTASYVAPVRRTGTSENDPDFDVRWDVVPGSTVGPDINIADMAVIVSGTGGFPPMFAAARAYDRTCPWAP